MNLKFLVFVEQKVLPFYIDAFGFYQQDIRLRVLIRLNFHSSAGFDEKVALLSSCCNKVVKEGEHNLTK